MFGLPMKPLLSLLSPGGCRGRLSILIYHRVLARDDPFAPWGIGAEGFTAQMAALRNHFNVIPLSEAIARLRSGSLPPRAAAVTFDDGYRDNLTVALPILRRYGIPATVFVASGFLDGGRMWNDTVAEALRVADGPFDLTDLDLGRWDLSEVDHRAAAFHQLLQRLKYLPQARRIDAATVIAERCGADLPTDFMLSSDELRSLHSAGVEIGGHTKTHPILAGLDDGLALSEIAGNRERLQEIIRAPIPVFAYPNGRPGRDYTETHVRMVRDCGYVGAVSTSSGTATRNSDLYQLPRFTPWDVTAGRFALRMARSMVGGTAARV